MGFEKKTWVPGEIIEDYELNRMEQGIEDAMNEVGQVSETVGTIQSEVNKIDQIGQDVSGIKEEIETLSTDGLFNFNISEGEMDELFEEGEYVSPKKTFKEKILSVFSMFIPRFLGEEITDEELANVVGNGFEGELYASKTDVGNIDQLGTTNRTDLVSAVNGINDELNEKIESTPAPDLSLADSPEYIGALEDLYDKLEELTVRGVIIEPEVVKDKLNEWLNEHPEVIAAIPDNSITERKMNADYLDVSTLVTQEEVDDVFEHDGEPTGFYNRVKTNLLKSFGLFAKKFLGDDIDESTVTRIVDEQLDMQSTYAYRSEVGEISDLQTDEKNSIVGAVNELNDGMTNAITGTPSAGTNVNLGSNSKYAKLGKIVSVSINVNIKSGKSDTILLSGIPNPVAAICASIVSSDNRTARLVVSGDRVILDGAYPTDTWLNGFITYICN